MILRVISYLLYLLIFGAVVVLALDRWERSVENRSLVQPCTQTLTYHIAGIDDRFDLSENDLRFFINLAGDLWSNAAGRQLLEYDPDGDIAVYLIYDQRQQLVEEERGIAQQIQSERLRFDRMHREFSRFKEEHDEARAVYLDFLSEYQSKVTEHNREVTEWNNRGGAPRDVREELQDRRERLDLMQIDLLDKQNEVNKTAERVTFVTNRLNEISERKNRLIEQYNTQFAGEYRFNQGEYINIGGERQINIYHYSSYQHLQRVLAHEVGHALGLGHLESPGSIMYPVVESRSVSDVRLSEQDIAAIQERCR